MYEWGIQKQNNGRWMVIYVAGLTRSYWDSYETREEAYRAAKAMNFGQEPKEYSD